MEIGPWLVTTYQVIGGYVVFLIPLGWGWVCQLHGMPVVDYQSFKKRFRGGECGGVQKLVQQLHV